MCSLIYTYHFPANYKKRNYIRRSILSGRKVYRFYIITYALQTKYIRYNLNNIIKDDI